MVRTVTVANRIVYVVSDVLLSHAVTVQVTTTHNMAHYTHKQEASQVCTHKLSCLL